MSILYILLIIKVFLPKAGYSQATKDLKLQYVSYLGTHGNLFGICMPNFYLSVLFFRRNDKVIVFSDNVFALKSYAVKMNRYANIQRPKLLPLVKVRLHATICLLRFALWRMQSSEHA